MNLKEFLNYRKNCPLCDGPLTTYLHSKKRQSIRYENGRMVVIFLLKSTKGKGLDYKVGYSFGLEDNSFCAEFYDKSLFRYEKEIPLFLVNRFKELNHNLKDLRFYRVCNSCQRYDYISFPFRINLKNNILESWLIRSESFVFIQNYGGALDDRYRVYRVNNWHSPDNDYNQANGDKKWIALDESWITYWITENAASARIDGPIPNLATALQLPLIPFISKEETFSRIKKLITFS